MEMEIKVDNDKNNKLMNRREITATANYSGSTPARESVKQELCKMLSLKPDASAIVRISQLYGNMSSRIILHSYATKEEMMAFEKEGKRKAKEQTAESTAKKQAEPEAKKPKEEKKHEEKKADGETGAGKEKEHKKPEEAKPEGK